MRIRTRLIGARVFRVVLAHDALARVVFAPQSTILAGRGAVAVREAVGEALRAGDALELGFLVDREGSRGSVVGVSGARGGGGRSWNYSSASRFVAVGAATPIAFSATCKRWLMDLMTCLFCLL
jgi:hypothetical protein